MVCVCTKPKKYFHYFLFLVSFRMEPFLIFNKADWVRCAEIVTWHHQSRVTLFNFNILLNMHIVSNELVKDCNEKLATCTLLHVSSAQTTAISTVVSKQHSLVHFNLCGCTLLAAHSPIFSAAAHMSLESTCIHVIEHLVYD